MDTDKREWDDLLRIALINLLDDSTASGEHTREWVASSLVQYTKVLLDDILRQEAGE